MINYYTSPSGSGDGLTISTPASVSAVKTLVQSSCATNDVTVHMAGGVYQITDTLSFGAADSGGAGYTVTWLSDPNDPAIISGGITITGWTLHDAGKNIWKADVPTGTNSRHLYVNGIKATRSKMSDSLAASFNTSAISTNAGVPTFAKPTDLEVLMNMEPWSLGTVMVDSYTRVGNTTTLTLNSSFTGFQDFINNPYNNSWEYEYGIGSIAGWSISNAYEFLTATAYGQWYLDTDTDTLYYVPRQGEDVTAVEVVMPVVEELIDIVSASNIDFQDVQFSYATWMQPTTDRFFIAIQANMAIPASFRGDGLEDQMCSYLYHPLAAVNVTYSDNINFPGCEFSKLGGMGLLLGAGATNCSSKYAEFTDIACNGLHIGNHLDATVPVIADRTSYISAENNTVHNVANEFIGGVGIFAGYTDNTQIIHNEIYNVPYSGVSIGWGWHYFPTGYAHANEVAYNKIYNVINSTRVVDGGCIYSLGEQGDTEPLLVHDNFLYDFGRSTGQYEGLYADQGTSTANYYNNVIMRSSSSFGNRWIVFNSYGGYITAVDNYATIGMTSYGITGNPDVEAFIDLPNANVSSWDTVPKNIALNAGVFYPDVTVAASVSTMAATISPPTISTTRDATVSATPTTLAFTVATPSITVVSNMQVIVPALSFQAIINDPQTLVTTGRIRDGNLNSVIMKVWDGSQLVSVTPNYWVGGQLIE